MTETLKEVDGALDSVLRKLLKPTLPLGTLHDIQDMFNKISVGQLASKAVIEIFA